jgi:hypothetical protein
LRATFAETLRDVAVRRSFKLPPPGDTEPLAGLDYADELSLKQEALRVFWDAQGLPGRPEDLAAASKPRRYRTTSKRRAFLRRGQLALAFSASEDPRPGLAVSALDPEEHQAVYAFLFEQLVRPASVALVAPLNYVIVRGTRHGLCVILNLRAFGPAIVRRAKQVGQALEAAGLGVRAAFLYLDPSGSDYYLEARRPAGRLSFKRLFGPEWLEVEIEGQRLRFPPVVFSQVNGPMLPAMTATARRLLQPLEGRRLLDLYCGYGFFSMTVGREAAEIWGVDAEGPAIEAALENARRTALGGRARFLAGHVTADFLSSRLRIRDQRPEAVLLDPPRQGTAPGVVQAIAERRPERVLHVFCGPNEIPRELESWRRNG